ncbi:MFS transporter [Cellulophaga baltica]|uniref:MFS transporter n=1 Tax=Cellulophaga TaxID=104264 RepID=UPI001C07D4F3|nr:MULTISPECIES: MFS transporter [Cellulophaga]MBU2997138.1 MFS transporter [Cellulophaga baltica]MDO6768536.1 MFS transporter [Cellulophaga sp. 1_MG-2023]
MSSQKLVLPIIVLAQFCCTSLWFASNGVMGDLITNFNLDTNALGNLTAAVQFGFISGTLIFAIFTIADRFSPSKVFFISALLGAFLNSCIIWEGNSLSTLLILRFSIGFFLAGIYPIGMKIATDYFEKGLGKSLGFLVGALVIGTAFPHLLKEITGDFSWKTVIITTSLLAIFGGLLIFLLVPDGPFRKGSTNSDAGTFFKVFKNNKFRSAAFGYFGHMWELYTFWAFVPLMLKTYNELHASTSFNIPLLSFVIIGSGGLACIVAGFISEKIGAEKTAFIALLLSCFCCLISGMIFSSTSDILFVAFLIFWGIVVVADSPLFSALVAQNVPAEAKGTALTIVNSIGYLITIISIQLISLVKEFALSNNIYVLLAIGPILGLIALSKKKMNKKIQFKT